MRTQSPSRLMSSGEISKREGDGAVTLKSRVHDKRRLAQVPTHACSLKIKNNKRSGRMGASKCLSLGTVTMDST